MKKLKVGIIGLGHNGRAWISAYKKSSLADVVAVCDYSGKKVKDAMQEFGVISGYQSHKEMLARKDIDAVSIHAPDFLHCQPFIDSLSAGKHTFVEKPMANTIPDLEKMVRAADQAKKKGLRTMVGQILRFNPLAMEIKKTADEGKLGEIFYMEADYIHNLKYQGSRDRYNSHLNMNWYLDREIPMVGGGCHPLDMLRWFKGKEIIEAQGYSNRIGFPDMKNDDCEIALFRFRDGCIAKVTVIYAPVSPMPYAYNVAVYGRKGTVLGDTVCTDEQKGFQSLGVHWGTGHPYEPEAEHFMSCITENRETIINAREGAKTAAAVITAFRAMKAGRPLKVPRF